MYLPESPPGLAFAFFSGESSGIVDLILIQQISIRAVNGSLQCSGYPEHFDEGFLIYPMHGDHAILVIECRTFIQQMIFRMCHPLAISRPAVYVSTHSIHEFLPIGSLHFIVPLYIEQPLVERDIAVVLVGA